jgi:hypothetical protein
MLAACATGDNRSRTTASKVLVASTRRATMANERGDWAQSRDRGKRAERSEPNGYPAHREVERKLLRQSTTPGFPRAWPKQRPTCNPGSQRYAPRARSTTRCRMPAGANWPTVYERVR